MDYEALVVQAELMAPVMFDHWQPLDGILAATVIEDPELRQRSRQARTYRRVRSEHGTEAAEEYFRERGWELPEHEHFLPLDVWGHGQGHALWVYCSSWAIPGEYERDLVHFTRRINFEQVERYVRPRDTRIYTAKSEFAAKYIPFQTVVTDALTWHVVGIKEELEEALALVRSIGKKRRRGYGVVRRWTVTEEADGQARAVFADGMLARPVPARLLELMDIEGEFEYSFTTYRPPYWAARWATRCAVAGRRLGEV